MMSNNDKMMNWHIHGKVKHDDNKAALIANKLWSASVIIHKVGWRYQGFDVL